MIKEEWKDYYQYLESLRLSGITNMFGSPTYLRIECPELSRKESFEIVSNWMENYEELAKKYNWK